jgi:hypothetical protein
MRKLVMLSAAAVLAGTIGSGQATPLSTAIGSANINIERALPSQGATKAWYRGRHYGWYRGHHYGWRHRHWHRYAYGRY